MEEQATYNRKLKYDVLIGIDPDVERSNQEERDSALLAISCSGLPIKYKVVESKINKENTL